MQRPDIFCVVEVLKNPRVDELFGEGAASADIVVRKKGSSFDVRIAGLEYVRRLG